MNVQTARHLRRVGEAAPFITVAILLLLPMVLPAGATYDGDLLERQRVVAAAFERVPHTIRSWVGVDIPVPAAATELLHPNAVLSRSYQRIPSGPTVSVLVVHCSDSRDMQGHYPPNCYPASGWNPTGDALGRTVEIDAAGIVIPARVYEFDRLMDLGLRTGIRIVNFFVLPDGSYSRDMTALRAASERRAMAVRGAAQVQMITSLDLPEDEAFTAVADLAGDLAALFRALSASGVQPS